MLAFAFLASGFEIGQLIIYFIMVICIVFAEHHLVSDKKYLVSPNTAIVFDVLFFALIMFEKLHITGRFDGVKICLIFLAVFVVSIALKRKFFGYRSLTALACICMVCLSFVDKVVLFDNGNISLISGE